MRTIAVAAAVFAIVAVVGIWGAAITMRATMDYEAETQRAEATQHVRLDENAAPN